MENEAIVEPVDSPAQGTAELVLRLKRTAIQVGGGLVVMACIMVLAALQADGVDSVSDIDWSELGDSALYAGVILVITAVMNFVRPLQTTTVN